MKKRVLSSFLLKTALVCSLACGLGAGLTACTPLERNHGNLIQDYQIERISSGKHTKQTVLRILGSPTTKAPFDDNIWYYIGQRTESYGVSRPDIVDQKILLVAFDNEGLVTQVENVDAQVLNELPIVASETPTAGTEENAVKQFFGNLGRFNQPLGVGDTTDDGIGGPGVPGGL